MSDGTPTTAELMTFSRRALADTVTASMAQVTLLRKELATAHWQAVLLALQRDALLAHCGRVEAAGRKVIPLGDVYAIMITDPADERKGCHGTQGGEGTAAAPRPAPQEP